MKTVAFAGPSLSAADRSARPEIDWRPPAEAGDLLRLSAAAGSTICLIDGYFDHRPAVRHKEILLLLSQGVRIFGASSIGALRAAEMQAFGMIGVGAIFGAYARRTIHGDDEVALIHAGADQDWRPFSIPLVDVRATLCRARLEDVITREMARALLEAAVSIHYIDRTWKSVCAAVWDGAGSYPFETWLEKGAVSRKHDDAVACLRAAAEQGGARGVRPELVRTCFLDALARECGVKAMPE
ncbi:MAG TPA: TfuA-like protein [Allosphingosinicella sp.]|nr:TfuA-like protein [Allosphingosinicella sp.]